MTPFPGTAPPYQYFSAPDPRDAWSSKISGWQRREYAESRGLLDFADPDRDGRRSLASASVSDGEETPPTVAAADLGLRSKYFAFRAERKRSVARQLSIWIQSQAKEHYVADGPIDHWATLEETLRGNGDDCDGLELLVYHALRDLGFSEREVYRAIVYRPSDGQHHMVTLWFELPDDPWVIDPTGAMTRSMVRMSEMPNWVPLKVFSETDEFTVRPPHDRDTQLASQP